MTQQQFEAFVKRVVPSAYDFKYIPEVKDLCYFTFNGVLNSIQLETLKARSFTMMAVDNKIEISLFSELLTE